MLNALCAAIPGARAGRHGRGGLRAARRGCPTWSAMQTRQPNLEGTGEIPLRRLVKEALRMRPSRLIVGEVRQEECLDLLIALNSGLPGHVHAARQLRPRGAGQDVHAAAARRRERVGRVRRADGRRVGRPRRAPRAWTPPASGGCARSSASPAASRATSSRPAEHVRDRAADGWNAPTGTRRTRTGTRRPASISARCSGTGAPSARAAARR